MTRQGAHPSGKSQGNLFFLQGQGKVREFCKMVRETRQGAHPSGKSQGNLFFLQKSGKSQGILKSCLVKPSKISTNKYELMILIVLG